MLIDNEFSEWQRGPMAGWMILTILRDLDFMLIAV